ncbi:MAG: hypothetical protein K2J51_09290 [Alistipes sp.]|nr:hypothetical protein [Alistipes sp.]
MKRLFVLFAFAAALVAGGCSDSAEDSGPDLRDEAPAIVGLWQTTSHRWTEYDENGRKLDSGTDYEDWFTLELTADGEFHWREDGINYGNNPYHDGTYTYDAATHTLTLNIPVAIDFGLQRAEVLRLTPSAMQLSWRTEYYNDSDYDVNILSFKRIE